MAPVFTVALDTPYIGVYRTTKTIWNSIFVYLFETLLCNRTADIQFHVVCIWLFTQTCKSFFYSVPYNEVTSNNFIKLIISYSSAVMYNADI